MKKLLAILAVLLLGFVAGRLSHHQPASAEGRGAALVDDYPCADLNDDSEVDLSDAIWLLNWLFRGQLPPVCKDSPELAQCQVALEHLQEYADLYESMLGRCNEDLVRVAEYLDECELELDYCDRDLERTEAREDECKWELSECRLRIGIPETGQTKCYDQDGVEIPCDSATCPGQDGRYATGCPNDENRFIDNLDGTVTDTCTGLMWQQDTADIDGEKGITVNDTLSWCEALAYCEDLVLADHRDWRLPNIRELQSIVDYGRCPGAYYDVFDSEGAEYWSSTSFQNPQGRAWAVDFWGGYVNEHDDVMDNFARAVRTASSH